MERKIKIKILEAIKSGLPISQALEADKYRVLFPHQNYFTTRIEGLGERVSFAEAEKLQKHFGTFISPVGGITFDKPE